MRIVRPARAFAWIIAAYAAGAAGLAACSLTTSLDGLSNGATESDVGPNGGDAATSETTPGVDAPVSGDAGANEADASLPFCSSIVPAPTFCDDFERSAPQGTWEEVVTTAGGVVTSEPSTRSAGGLGRELHTSIAFFTAGGVSQARLSRTGIDAANEITVSYALRIDAPPPQGVQQLMNIRVVFPSEGFCATYLYAHPDGVSFVEQTFPNDASVKPNFVEHGLGVPVIFGTWQRIAVTMSLGASPHHRVTIDGVVAYDAPADPFFHGGAAQLSAGIDFSGAPTGPLSVRIDDLFVVAK